FRTYLKTIPCIQTGTGFCERHKRNPGYFNTAPFSLIYAYFLIAMESYSKNTDLNYTTAKNFCQSRPKRAGYAQVSGRLKESPEKIPYLADSPIISSTFHERMSAARVRRPGLDAL
ncbi:MAG: hypothetical protein IJT31_03270, partial [Oscillibacter sp.]|nr:hypothetical protein [Oscillibacter sp.]